MTMSTYDRVKEFHKAFQLNKPRAKEAVLEFRLGLIWEEFQEVLDAAGYGLTDSSGLKPEKLSLSRFTQEVNNAQLLKELADLDYVVAGTPETFGWDFNEAGKRVHESNMSKLGDDGLPVRRDDGKVLKGPNYKAPDLTDLVEGENYGCGCRPCQCGRS